MQIGVSEAEATAPNISVNEIFRRYGASYASQYGMTAEQRRGMQDMIDCRSGALGGHIAQCDACDNVYEVDLEDYD